MSQTKLWSKGKGVNTLVEAYTAGEDIFLDQKLVAYDIYGTLAHVTMLNAITIISDDELAAIKKELVSILEKYHAGEYVLQPGDEDVHTRIENDVTAKLSEAGGKIHTGRSRNDQVLVDTRLLTKDQLQIIALQTSELALAFQKFAKTHEFTPIPGYTHMQQAMLSSVGAWAGQFAESLLDDLSVLQAAYELNDQSPLGTGAGYGVSLPLDRQLTAKLLGFSKVQNNAVYAQNSRGKVESVTLGALSQIMLTLGRFASDLLLFTTAEFRFFTLAEELTTGSSIMPQKRNLDIMELMRARSKTMLAHQSLVQSIISGLPSGYNRDLQEMKKPYLESFDLVQQNLAIAQLTLENITVNAENMAKHISKDMFAAHHAYQMVESQGIPFREAYRYVGTHLSEIPEYDPSEVLRQTISQGSGGNLQLDVLEVTITKQQSYWQEEQKIFKQTIKKLTTSI